MMGAFLLQTKEPGDCPRLIDGPSWEPGCRRKTSGSLTGPLAKVHVGGKIPTLGGRPLREDHFPYNTVCPADAVYTAKRGLGGTAQPPVACSCKQTDTGGHPPACEGRPLREDRSPYSTFRFRFASACQTFGKYCHLDSLYTHVLQCAPDTKMPRGIPSALGGPPIRGNQSIYSTCGFMVARFERSAA